ncbi:LVIVD repeat-containing protein [Gemmatimonas sp.]|uniref:LVIVD repeat-containing protein n=1 Tax=Gemmatimonas sp. TaxID=1962908 RepID=UPI0037BE6F3F
MPTLLSAQTYPSAKDPRTTLKPGRFDAGIAEKNMRLLSTTPKPAQFDTVRGLTFVNSDLAFRDNLVIQANFAGFTIWDIKNPAKPALLSVVRCITSQGDPTIYGNLLFLSAEGAGNRNDCADGGVKDPKDHMAGVRIFDVSDPTAPKLVKNVQTCKGSHTHTLVPHPKDKNVIYLYVSGQQGARPDTELAGCKNGNDPADVSNSLYQLDIIKVELDRPENARVIPGARIFTGLGGAGECKQFCAPVDPRFAGRQRQAPAEDMPDGPRNCHDVTAYPAMNLLAASCSTHSIMVDISNPEKPFRIDALSDTNNFQGRHTAAFSNDGKKIIQTDEWGGGTSPMCQASSMIELGGNTVITLDAKKKQSQRAYFKLPAAQSAEENCVSHNGGIIPVPGRDLYIQGWYQGGVSIMDFTDPDKAFEVGYFDRGSIDPPRPVDVPSAASAGMNRNVRGNGNVIGGSWGAYYWNGLVFSSEMDRGLDILELTPSAELTANEIAAAKLVTFKEYNPQSQPKMVWPAAFVVVRSYLDQLVRGQGLAAARTTAIDAALTAAEQQTGAARAAALRTLATQVDRDVAGAKDGARVRAMAGEIRRLAAATK